MASKGEAMKRITDPTHVTQAPALVDKMLSYPREPTHRGAACPPAPFGRTTSHARTNTSFGGNPEYPLTDAAEAELARGAPALTSGERTQLNAVAAAGQTVVAQAATLEEA